VWSELYLFSVPFTQVAVEEGVWDNVKPYPNFSKSTITFDVPGDSIDYVSLSVTELWLKVKIEGEGYPVNNFMHSFSQVQVYLNNNEVENTNSFFF
jgi:hypothetical protein